MEENKNIDKQFRNALGNYQQQPPARVKEAVFAQLDEMKKSRRPLFGWITGLSALVIFILLGFWWFNAANSSIASSGNDGLIANEVAVTTTNSVENNSTSKSSNNSTAVEIKAETKSTSKEVNTQVNNADSKSENANTVVVKNNAAKNSLANNTNQNSTKNKTHKSKSTNTNSVKASELSHVKMKNELSVASTNNQVIETPVADKNSTTSISNDSKSENSSGEKSIAHANPETNSVVVAQKPETSEVTKQLEADKKSSAFSLDISTGPSFFKSRIGSEKAANSEYVNLLDGALNPTLSWNANVEIAMQLKHNVYLQTGLNYDWINENFSYSNTATTVNYSNRLEYLDIPVLVGIKFGKEKFSFNVQGGISYGILTKAKGYTIDFNTKDAEAIDKSMLNSSLMSVLFRASLNYQVCDRIGIFVQPAERLNLKSITKSNAPASIELSKFSINAGMHINF